MEISISAWMGVSLLRRDEMRFSAAENVRSEGADDPGMDKTFKAT